MEGVWRARKAERVVSQLLTEMDGIQEMHGVVVMLQRIELTLLIWLYYDPADLIRSYNQILTARRGKKYLKLIPKVSP